MCFKIATLVVFKLSEDAVQVGRHASLYRWLSNLAPGPQGFQGILSKGELVIFFISPTISNNMQDCRIILVKGLVSFL